MNEHRGRFREEMEKNLLKGDLFRESKEDGYDVHRYLYVGGEASCVDCIT